MMKAKHAWYSKACPYMLIVQLADGSKWWCRMIPARHLTEQDLEPLPRSYHCIRDYELSAIEARVMYGLETEAETARKGPSAEGWSPRTDDGRPSKMPAQGGRKGEP